VHEERDIVSVVVEELRRTFGNIRKVELETVRWETHAWPDIGEDAQDVINRQIGQFDVLVGIMWRRFGTPTNRSGSGTGEEFERAYDLFVKHGRPKIMFYFRKTPFYTTSEKEINQFRKVVRFRHKLEKLGVLFWEYETALDFERDLREHLMKQILEVTEPAGAEPKSGAPLVFLSCAREDSNRVVPVSRALSSAGFRPWLDIQDLLPGQDWEMSIKQAIQRADVFLVFISEATVSRRGYVQKEIALATHHMLTRPANARFLIPVRLDAVEPPVNLMRYEWVDLFSPDGMDKLIFAVRAAWKNRQEK
jgi:hypothetical protein